MEMIWLLASQGQFAGR